MSNLKNTLEALASDFARTVIAALRSASIDEITGLSSQSSPRRVGRPTGGESLTVVSRKRGPGGRLGRRSVAQIGQMVDGIVNLLAKSPSGLRAEQIREALGVQAKELPRPLADALSAGRISKRGQKRATTYFAGGEGTVAKRRGRRKRG
jgi:hypothetical protein